jgi:hypothetical protein
VLISGSFHRVAAKDQQRKEMEESLTLKYKKIFDDAKSKFSKFLEENEVMLNFFIE